MRITRNVIQDLLPLHLSGEASPDTAALVEEYLETDPEMRRIAEDMAASETSAPPRPLSKEKEMEAYKRANTLMVVRTVSLAAIIAGTLLCALLIVPLIYKLLFQ